MFAEDEADLLLGHSTSHAELDVLVARRVAGEPLEHLVGWVDVAGIRAAVGPGVFVPRQRSRVLVRAAVDLVGGRGAPVVVEICCGAAAIAAAIQHAVPAAEVWAADLDPQAVVVARRNLAPERVLVSDLFQGLPDELRGRIDVVVANAPYVPTDEISLMPVEAREHEPRFALDGGVDGVAVHRRIADQAPAWLSPTGSVVIETSRYQAAATSAALATAGLRTTVVRDDDVDGTCVVGRVGLPGFRGCEGRGDPVR